MVERGIEELEEGEVLVSSPKCNKCMIKNTCKDVYTGLIGKDLKELIIEIEKSEYECEAGSLRNNEAFIELKKKLQEGEGTK